MKFSFSLGTVGDGAGHALWYWNGLSEMLGVCGYDGLEIPFQAWSFNGGRGSAPVCAEAIRTKFGSVGAYEDFLRGCGIREGLSGLHITAQNVLTTMLEYNVPIDRFFDRVLELTEETAQVLLEAGAKDLIFSPSPSYAMFAGLFGGDEERYTARITETIVKMAEIAAGKGLTLSLRNEFYGIYRGGKICALLDKLPQSVCYSPDTAQLFIARADAAALIEKYPGRLAAVKLCDTFFEDKVDCWRSRLPESPQEGESQRVYCTFGNGSVDLDGIFAALVKVGYNGWVVLESKRAFNTEKAMMLMQVYRRKHFDPVLTEV